MITKDPNATRRPDPKPMPPGKEVRAHMTRAVRSEATLACNSCHGPTRHAFSRSRVGVLEPVDRKVARGEQRLAGQRAIMKTVDRMTDEEMIEATKSVDLVEELLYKCKVCGTERRWVLEQFVPLAFIMRRTGLSRDTLYKEVMGRHLLAVRFKGVYYVSLTEACRYTTKALVGNTGELPLEKE